MIKNAASSLPDRFSNELYRWSKFSSKPCLNWNNSITASLNSWRRFSSWPKFYSCSCSNSSWAFSSWPTLYLCNKSSWTFSSQSKLYSSNCSDSSCSPCVTSKRKEKFERALSTEGLGEYRMKLCIKTHTSSHLNHHWQSVCPQLLNMTKYKHVWHIKGFTKYLCFYDVTYMKF